MELKCRDVREKLSEYADDMLAKDEKNAVDRHINSCGDCSAQYRELCDIISELGSLPDQPLPDDFYDKLHKRLSKKRKSIGYIFAHSYKPLSAVAAGLLLVLLIRTGYYSNINQLKTAYVDDAKLQQEYTAGQTSPAPADKTDEPAVPEKTAGAQSYGRDKQNAPQTTDNSKKEGEIAEKDWAAIQNENEENTQQQSLAPQSGEEIQAEDDQGQQMSDEAIAQELPPEIPPEPEKEEQKMAFRMFSGGGNMEKADVRADYETDGNVPLSSPDYSYYASSHDDDAPSFVSVIIFVEDFEQAALLLKEKYNAKVIDNSITLELNNDDFQQVMDLMLNFGARVEQQEAKEPLNVNKCVIVPYNTE